jgi:hypothetical protein
VERLGGAVVGEHTFDADAVAGKEGDRAPEEAGEGSCALVAEYFVRTMRRNMHRANVPTRSHRVTRTQSMSIVAGK